MFREFPRLAAWLISPYHKEMRIARNRLKRRQAKHASSLNPSFRRKPEPRFFLDFLDPGAMGFAGVTLSCFE